MRRVNQAGLELIKHFEGFSPVVYADVAGRPTIGYGHLLRAGEEWGQLTEGEAEALLRQDVTIAERAVSRLMHVTLSDNQFAALVSFTFNLGSGALQRSTLRQKINRKEHDGVAHEFRRWIWAGGRRWPGLMRRREVEARLFEQA